jgi:hypothetical protein
MMRIFGSKRDDVTVEWRKVHYEELNDLYSSLNIIWVIKTRIMRWAGHVARLGRAGVCTGFWWGNLREIDHSENPDADGRIILRYIFRKLDWEARTGLIWLRIWKGGGHSQMRQ